MAAGGRGGVFLISLTLLEVLTARMGLYTCGFYTAHGKVLHVDYMKPEPP